jgi:phosphoribosylamine--glycine ligase
MAAARAFLDTLAPPFVLKADGLAAGKGVVIAATRQEAEDEAQDMLSGRFGAASSTLVIEEFLTGVEASVFALCDGRTAVAMAAAQDHKRVGEGDTGPNTGGMGAFSPTPAADDAMIARVMAEIVMPTLRGMEAEGAPFRGVLYAGLMIGADGPKLIEYNARFGDPECQVLMMRLKSDIVPALLASANGTLGALPPLDWDARPAVVVVMAAEGYPGEIRRGTVIRGLEAASDMQGVEIFHAGTAHNDSGEIIAAGGRVLGVTARGETLRHAVERAYAAVDRIDWPGGFCRRDIAWGALSQ